MRSTLAMQLSLATIRGKSKKTKMAIVLLIIISVTALCVCGWLYKAFTYWNQSNIPQIRHKSNVLALIWSYCTNWRLSQHMMQLYVRCRNESWSCVGSFLFTRPILFVASPALLKEIVVQHSAEFGNRGSYYNEESAADLNLFNMQDDEWCKWRRMMSSCFAPKRMRQYVQVFNDEMLQSMQRLNGCSSVDFFEFANRYACSIAGWLFLGARLPDLDLDHEREAFASVFRPSWRHKLTDILSYYCPCLLRLCNVAEFPRDAFERVKNCLNVSLDAAADGGLPEESFTKQLLELQAKDASIRRENIVGVLSALFLGGLKSTTPLLTLACYELAKNAEIQDKVRLEIENQGEITYDSLMNMLYMQNVLNEVMRLHNGGPLLIRECNQTCTLASSGLTVEKGMLIIASLRGILMDNEYFPNSAAFDPDRFSNSSNSRQDVFHPFGIGRHICIGNKFALLQAKIFLSHLLANFKLSVNERTTTSFQDKNARLSADAIYLNVTPIS